MENRKINWGVLGCSNISKIAAIPAILEAQNANLYAVASRSKDKADDYYNMFNPQKAYYSYEEMLEDKNIDAVYVSLPNSMHKHWSIMAMKSGKHVLCEKPMSVSAKDTDEMRDESIKDNVLLMEAFMYRLNPKTIKVKELVDSGAIGKVKNIYANFTFFEPVSDLAVFKKELAGGCTYDVGCYCINIMRYITGEEPGSVFAKSIFLDNGSGVDINTSAILEFKSGIPGMLVCGFGNFLTNKYEIYGTKGRIEVPYAFLPEEINRIIIEKEDSIQEIRIKSKSQYTLEIEHFSDCILNNAKPYITLDDTSNNIKVLEAILKSSNEKREIFL